MQRVFFAGADEFFGSSIDWFREIILIPFPGYFFPTDMRYQFLSFAQSAISRHVDANVQQLKAFNFCDLQCSCLQKTKLQTQKGCENRTKRRSCRFFWVSINLLTWTKKKGFFWRANVWNMFTIIFGNPAFDPKSDSFDGEKSSLRWLGRKKICRLCCLFWMECGTQTMGRSFHNNSSISFRRLHI